MTLQTESLKELTDSLLKRYAAQKAIALVFGGCVIKVLSNSMLLLDKLREYYKGFLAGEFPIDSDITITVIDAQAPQFDFNFTVRPPDPGKTKIKEAYVDFIGGRIVRKLLTGMVLIFDGQFNLAIGPSMRHSNQVINFINNRYIEWKLNQGCLLMHASGIQWQKKGLAIAGFSGMGKSTLALHLMSQGANFVSNDRLMVQKVKDNLQMFGVPKLPRINPGTILNNADLTVMLSSKEKDRLGKLSVEDLWQLEEKYDVDIDAIFGEDKFVLTTPMAALVILNWTNKGKAFDIRPVNLKKRQDLLPAVRKDPGLFFRATRDNYFSEFTLPESYFNHLQSAKVYEITGAVDFVEGVKACMDILSNKT